MQVHGSCCLAWFNTDYAGLYEEPLSCADEEDHHPTIQDYTQKQIPYGYGGCGSWLREYFAGCDLGGGDDEAYSDQTFQSNQVCECDFSCYDDMYPNYNENDHWLGCGGLEDDLDDLEWDKWEETTLYDRIFGY